MPTYAYRCTDCDHRFDAIQRFADDPLTACPACGGPVKRVIGPVGVVFKGSGWYINDSRKPAEAAKGKEAKHDDAKASDGKETGKGDAPKPSETAKTATTEAPAAKADARSATAGAKPAKV